MDLHITSKGLETTPELHHLIERKLSRLNRHLSNIIEIKVEIIEEMTKSPEDRFLVRVSVNGSNTQLHGEERGETVLIAIDKIARVMQRQVEHHKGKQRDKKGKLKSRTKEKPNQKTEQILERKYIVKRLDVKPMPLSEATDQMELLDYDFFFFYNTNTEKLSLLYKRKDGNYGLIEPERG